MSTCFFLLTNNKNLENTQKMSSLTVTGKITGCCRNVRLSTLIAFDLFLPMKTVTGLEVLYYCLHAAQLRLKNLENASDFRG